MSSKPITKSSDTTGAGEPGAGFWLDKTTIGFKIRKKRAATNILISHSSIKVPIGGTQTKMKYLYGIIEERPQPRLGSSR
jgi:hypothetical protein